MAERCQLLPGCTWFPVEIGIFVQEGGGCGRQKAIVVMSELYCKENVFFSWGFGSIGCQVPRCSSQAVEQLSPLLGSCLAHRGC